MHGESLPELRGVRLVASRLLFAEVPYPVAMKRRRRKVLEERPIMAPACPLDLEALRSLHGLDYSRGLRGYWRGSWKPPRA